MSREGEKGKEQWNRMESNVIRRGRCEQEKEKK